MRIDTRIAVGCDPDSAYAVLEDYGRDREWRTNVKAITVTPPGPVREGSRVDEVLEIAGTRWRTGTVVTTLGRRQFEYEGSGSRMTVRGGRGARSEGDATTVYQWIELNLRGPAHVAEPTVGFIVRLIARADLRRLKALLEGAGPRDGGA